MGRVSYGSVRLCVLDKLDTAATAVVQEPIVVVGDDCRFRRRKQRAPCIGGIWRRDLE